MIATTRILLLLSLTWVVAFAFQCFEAKPVYRLLTQAVLQPESIQDGTTIAAETDSSLAVDVSGDYDGIIKFCRLYNCGVGHFRLALAAYKDQGSEMKSNSVARKIAHDAWAKTQIGPEPPKVFKPLPNEIDKAVRNIVVNNPNFTGSVLRPGWWDSGAPGSSSVAESTNRWTYKLGRGGEVRSVEGFVHPIGHPSKPAIEHYCDHLYEIAFGVVSPGSQKTRNKRPSDPRGDVDKGHIVAATLGGSNSDPLNFFPQRGDSNRDSKQGYQLGELFAQSKREELYPNAHPSKAGQCVKIMISFDYPNHMDPLRRIIASGGKYVVLFDPFCALDAPTVWEIQSWSFVNPIDHLLPQFPPL